MPFPVLSPFRYTHDKTKMTGTVVRGEHPGSYTFTPGFTGAESAPVYMPHVPTGELRWLFRTRYWNIKDSVSGYLYTYETSSNDGQRQKRITFIPDVNSGWRDFGSGRLSFNSEDAASRYLRRIVYEFEPGTLKPADRRSGWGLDHDRLGEVLLCGQDVTYIPRVMVEEVCRTGVVWVGPETGSPWDGSVVTRVIRDYVSPEIEPPGQECGDGGDAANQRTPTLLGFSESPCQECDPG